MQTHKKFQKTYLHIGLGKTGTSTIQEQVYRNSDRLEREFGIHYPRAFEKSIRFKGNHSPLLRAMCAKNDLSQSLQPSAVIRSPKHRARIQPCFERGFADSKADQLLISAEGVGHFSNPYLQLLAAWLHEFSEEIEIVACIRHPIDALSSEIQQRIKFGYVLEDLYAEPPYYHFSALFDRIENAFPHSKMNLYTFSEAIENPKGLAGAFLQKIGVDMDLPIHIANPSMSHEAALLLSTLNRARPATTNHQPNPSRAPTDVRECMRISGRKFSPPPEVYEKAALQAEKEVIWLQEKYGITLEDTSISHSLDYNYFSDKSIEDIAVSLATLSKIRYTGSSPFRFLIGFVRELKSMFLRYL